MTKLCILSDILSNDTIVTSSFKDDCLVKYYDYNNSASAFQDLLKNGKGILVNPTRYKHIYDLKSDDKQTSKNKLLKI